MDGRDTLHPKPKGPLPAPELYDKLNDGVKPERPGLSGRGTESDPVPVAELTANFSPIPRIAPPPFGRLTWGDWSAPLVDGRSPGRASSGEPSRPGVEAPPSRCRRPREDRSRALSPIIGTSQT